MHHDLAFIGAVSNLGARPYDDGVARFLNRAPEVFRERGLVERLHAADLGDVVAPAYRDARQSGTRARNEAQVAAYSRALSVRVAQAIGQGQFPLVIGGDCSIVLGCLLGARRTAGASLGLVYVDAHADFAIPEESTSGAVASMALALASGRGESLLARLADAPLVLPRRAVLVGRRAGSVSGRGHAALATSGVLDVPDTVLLTHDPSAIAGDILEQASRDAAGFWVQVDVDVFNPAAIRAVETPEPGGPMPHELAALLAPLVRDPRALGLSLTVYDPALDPDRAGARQLIKFLDALLR